jgi:hypothetical protein
VRMAVPRQESFQPKNIAVICATDDHWAARTARSPPRNTTSP